MPQVTPPPKCSVSGKGHRQRPAQVSRETFSSNWDRIFCPFCDERVRRVGEDRLEYCPEHGVLEGVAAREPRALDAETARRIMREQSWGYGRISVFGIPVVWDAGCPPGEVRLVDMEGSLVAYWRPDAEKAPPPEGDGASGACQ